MAIRIACRYGIELSLRSVVANADLWIVGRKCLEVIGIARQQYSATSGDRDSDDHRINSWGLVAGVSIAQLSEKSARDARLALTDRRQDTVTPECPAQHTLNHRVGIGSARGFCNDWGWDDDGELQLKRSRNQTASAIIMA